MKRLLLFVLLFGAALLVLRWFEGPGIEPEPIPEPDAGKDPEPGTIDDEELSGRPKLGGPGTLRIYSEKSRQDPTRRIATFTLESEDTRSTSEYDEFRKNLLKELDPETLQQRAELTAEIARVRPLIQPGQIEYEYERLVELSGLEGTLLQGPPFVPLTIRAPSGIFDATDDTNRILYGKESVVIDSPSLEATGEGWDVYLDEGTWRLADSATTKIRQEERDPVVLSSSGPTEVRRPKRDDAPGLIEVEAWVDVALTFLGEDGSVLRANHIFIQGRERQVEGGKNTFVLERLDADGRVEWQAGETVARGDLATLFFDAKGGLESWRLEGQPTLRISLELLSKIELPEGLEPGEEESNANEAEEEGFVLVEGQGPLTGQAGGVRSFEMAGPARVTSGDVRLLAGGDVSGLVSNDEDFARVTATGGVVLRTGVDTTDEEQDDEKDEVLETAELVVEVRRGDDDSVVQNISTRGGAKLDGWLPDGHAFALTSSDRIEARYVLPPKTASDPDPAPRWYVDEAQDVVLSAEGPNGFTARAAEVLDFDPVKPKLGATGDVSIESAAGRGAGEKLIVEGTGNFHLEGKANERAWFERPDGRADARSITVRSSEVENVQSSSLVAIGNVHADFRRPPESEQKYEGYELRCDHLTVDAVETTEPRTKAVERRLDVYAEHGVDGTVGWGGDRTRLTCNVLDAFRVERWDGASEEATLLGAEAELVADGTIVAHLTRDEADLDLECRHLHLTRTEGAPRGDTNTVDATGAVDFSLLVHREADEAGREPEKDKRYTIFGKGERLTLDENFTGSLVPLPGERVNVVGHILSQNAPFELTAERFEYRGMNSFVAERPDLVILQFDTRGAGRPGDLTGLRANARRMTADPEQLQFIDDVTILSGTQEGAPWSLSADRISIQGSIPSDEGDAELDILDATGEVSFALGARGKRLTEETLARARGHRLTADSLWGTLRLEGEPGGDDARITSPAFVSAAEWINFDPTLRIIQATGPGRLLSNAQTSDLPETAWELEYSAFSTSITPDEIIYVLREPRFLYPVTEGTLEASWGVLWLDRQRWMKFPESVSKEVGVEAELRVPASRVAPIYPEGSPMAKLLALLRDKRLGNLVREVYLEGPIHMHQAGDNVAEASAIYFDSISGNGLIVDAIFEVTGEAIGEEFEQVRVEADWLRPFEDGSIQAKEARISSSPLSNPGLRIVTGDLRVFFTDQEDDPYEVLLRDNRIDLFESISIPLPSFRFSADERYRPSWSSLRLSRSARFGTEVSTGVSRPAGRVGRVINEALGGDPKDYDADWRIDASYLSSRGALLDVGLDMESQEKYGLEAWLGIVPDTGRDKGYIRVDDDDRENLRLWFRADSRLQLDDGEWIDVSLSKQSDAGVQSEFFERDFERHERDESYVQWSRHGDERFYDITVKARTEDFRSDVDELPSAGIYHGRAPLFRLGSLPVLHTGNTRASYVYRRAGEFGFQSPFSSVPAIDATDSFVDGFGNRDLGRIDTDQRLEAPFRVGIAGLRATPFLGTRFTAWTEGKDPDVRARRFLAEAGMRLSTTFWRETRDDASATHLVSPYLSVSRELSVETSGSPVPFDATENPVGGNRFTVGLRSRLDVGKDGAWLDLELRNTHVTDMRDGTEDGWLPLEVFGLLQIEPWDLPARVWHEGRYDLDDGRTDYAFTAIASRLSENLGLEAGHRVARDAGEDRVLEAASISGLYRWSPKWEFEAKETFSLMESDALDTSFIIRRYGADTIFEVESSVREGEGSSFGISIRPRFGWRAPRIGSLDR